MSRAGAKYSLCAMCEQAKFTHVDGKCLFGSTTFRPMTRAERVALQAKIYRSLTGYAESAVQTYTGRFPMRSTLPVEPKP